MVNTMSERPKAQLERSIGSPTACRVFADPCRNYAVAKGPSGI
jgi:hypothetical protein